MLLLRERFGRLRREVATAWEAEDEDLDGKYWSERVACASVATKVTTIFGIFSLSSFLLVTLLAFTPEGIVVGF